MNVKIEKLIFGFLFLVVVGALFFQNYRSTPEMGTAQLTWNANAEEDLGGYRIYYGTASRTGDCPPAGYPKKVEVKKDTTSYQLTGLEPGNTYYFSVTSYNKGGKESCFSEEMKKEIKGSFFDRITLFFRKLLS